MRTIDLGAYAVAGIMTNALALLGATADQDDESRPRGGQARMAWLRTFTVTNIPRGVGWIRRAARGHRQGTAPRRAASTNPRTRRGGGCAALIHPTGMVISEKRLSQRSVGSAVRTNDLADSTVTGIMIEAQSNHEGHEEHEVIQYSIGDPADIFRVNPIAATVFDGSLICFVFLRVLRGELLFPGSSFRP